MKKQSKKFAKKSKEIIKNKNFKIIQHGITAPQGFKVYSGNAGIRNRKDLMVLYSDVVCNAAGVFTTNKVKGAPLIVTMEKLKKGKAQALVVNSGNSNVLTGAQGIKDAKVMCLATAHELEIKEDKVLVCSTGIIGRKLPIDKIKSALKKFKTKLSNSKVSAREAAQTIMTTDLVTKELAVTIDKITIGVMAKGSGMIHPNMATMLCFITTDAQLTSNELSKMLKNSISKSFNMISVDSDTSTSDAVIIMANGMAGKVDIRKFQNALDYICLEMSKKIIRDGEGASKTLEVNVVGCKTQTDAEKIGKSIINSMLVKAGFPTQLIPGRIFAAAGSAGVAFDQNAVDLYYEDELIVTKGKVIKYDKEKMQNILDNVKLNVTLDFKKGTKSATVYGCDLTYDYVKINREYYT
jgi:glutamate N-acetyltransferase/amino-acid N-acetyltransferase